MVRWNPRNKNYFQSFGYQFTRMGDLFSVKTQDLQRYSAIKIHAICDSCGKQAYISYGNYRTVTQKNCGRYYCNKCSCANTRKSDLQNGLAQKKIDLFRAYCNKKNYIPLSAEDDFKTVYSKMRYICPLHGEQSISYINMEQGQGCKYCGYDSMKQKQRLPSQSVKKYIEQKNGNVLLNSQDYVNTSTRNLRVVCGMCNEEYITSFAYFKDSLGVCPKCQLTVKHVNNKLYPDDITNRCRQLGITIYNPQEYIGSHDSNLLIKCTSCGVPYYTSWQLISHGYTRCNHCHIKSYGERRIKQFLDNNNISYDKQHRFNDCRNIQPLPFDFYLFDYNLAIEYDGEQHFWAVYGEQQFQKTKTNDRIKTDYCNKKAIKLIRIPYYQIDRIEQILIQALNL